MNIDYNLALKLKEAGFPQDGFWKTCPCSELSEGTTYVCRHGNNSKVIAPTLSELVEACGDCLSHIKKWNGYWWAVSHCGHAEHEIGGNNLEISRLTPEEAVANLWLELKKKK